MTMGVREVLGARVRLKISKLINRNIPKSDQFEIRNPIGTKRFKHCLSFDKSNPYLLQ